MQPKHGRGHPAAAGHVQFVRSRLGPRRRESVGGRQVHPVEDQSGQRHLLLGSRSTKNDASRRASGSGAATTTNAVPDRRSSSVRRLARARGSRRTSSPARRRTAEMSARPCPPMILVSTRLNIAEAGTDHLRVGPAAGLRRRRQQLDQPAVQEPRQPVRGVQEVQRRPGRRGVDDDQVPLPVVRS